MAELLHIDMNQVEESAGRAAAKRMRRTDEPVDFRLVFSPVGNLLTLATTLKNLLTTVRFVIWNKPTFQGIQCDSTSPALTCMVKSRLVCTVEVDDALNEGKRAEFSVNIDEFANVIKSTNNPSLLEIIRYRGKNEIVVVAPRSNPVRKFSLRTLLQEPVDNRLQNMDCKFQVQIRLSDFKDFCRTSQLFKADTISISIDIPKSGLEKGTSQSFVEFGCDSDSVNIQYVYDPIIHTNERGQIQVVCDEQASSRDAAAVMHAKAAYDRVYSEQFSVEFLNQFFKSVEKSSVWINLTEDDGPMIVHYGLGNEQSYMRLVLAPKETVE